MKPTNTISATVQQGLECRRCSSVVHAKRLKHALQIP